MRLEVTHGGVPSDGEIAAVVVALTGLGRGGAPTPRRWPGEPAWVRAARLEAAGAPRSVSADDLAARERAAGWW